MVNALDYLANKYDLNLDGKPPIIIESETKKLGRHYALPEIFAALGFKVGAEIGVEEGVYSARLCRKIPGLKLYSIDAWLVHGDYQDHVDQDRLDRFYKNTQERLAPYDCEIIRKFSMDAVDDFEDGSLDFVYIDGNHRFIGIARDIDGWEKKVRVGGIVAGHDYRRIEPTSDNGYHVRPVVDAYTLSYGIRPWFVLQGDKCPTWLWVKQ